MLEPKADSLHKLIGVQYLRAVAALMVVYLHALEQIPAYAPLLRRLSGNAHMANGVDLFFVISGFIMVATSSRASPGDFAIRRIIRIVPLYWCLTLALLILALWRPDLLRTTVLSAEYLAKSLLFIPYPNPGQNGRLLPLLVPGWTLNLEMFFYVIFTGMLFLPRNRRVVATTVVFVIIVWCAPLLGHATSHPEIGFFGDFRLFEFLFGMIIGEAFLRGLPRLPKTIAWGTTLGGLLMLFLGLPFLALPLGSLQQVLIENALPAAVVVFGTLLLEPILRRRPWPFLALLGDASYSMYVSHVFLLGVARTIWARTGLEWISAPYAIAFGMLSLILTVIGTLIVYRWLEIPILRELQGLYRRRRSPAPLGGVAPAWRSSQDL
jgi:exopolysaccharide production protein ExoZ